MPPRSYRKIKYKKPKSPKPSFNNSINTKPILNKT